MRFCSLGSGSSGNATLVEARSGSHTTRVLVDCGFSLRELTLRLARAGLQLDELDAVFVTHEHGDHVGCALALSRRHAIPLWTSRGTWRAMRKSTDALATLEADEAEAHQGLLRFARDGEAIVVGAMQLLPYTVPHDAGEPLQLVLTDGAHRLGVLTDTGSSTEHIEQQLARCDALLIECNHDADLLAASAYPASLKARIGGRLGHLSNAQAAELLTRCLHPRLRHVAAAHLSERNNSPDLVRAALAAACGANLGDLPIADPQHGFPWLALG
jgi:phosphoribosyl 1,2-cyclic phosphodiesterase